MDRRTFIKGTGVAGIAGLAGCTGGPQGSGDGGSENTSTSGTDGTTEPSGGDGGASASADVNVGMVYALGGLGDKSFNDAAQRGIKQAKQELGISFNEAQPSSAEEFPQFQRQFAQSTNPDYDLVSCIGFAQQSALKNTAPNFPDQKFMLVDSVVEQDNVANYLFKEQEGSFQVGYLAGLLTMKEFSAGAGETNPDQKKIGFVGGVDAPLIRKFQAGYEKGAAHADGSVEVLVSYTGSFSDPSAGKEAALSMYDQGADIVYHAAGASGVGVFQAAQEKGRYAIGVDSDQSKTEPNYKDVILASMVKRVDTAVFESVESVVNGKFKGGSTVTLGLEQEGVACVYGQALGSEISSDVKSKIDTSAKAIISGGISVPVKP